MRSNNFSALFLVVLLTAGCGGGGSGGSAGSGDSGDGIVAPAANVLPITVPVDQLYPNKPTVSVTVCQPGSTACRTIDNVLVDTGSFGLRIFNQTIPNLSLSSVSIGSSQLAECVAYLDGTATWGPIRRADVKLAGETAFNIPIQIIDTTYFSHAIPAECDPDNVILDPDPEAAHYNGILGVGIFAEDCGGWCADATDNGLYFVCDNSGCRQTAVPIPSQVQNPVAHLKQNNNGVIVKMSNIRTGGARTASGSLILGIDTQTNNSSSGVRAYPTNPDGEFTTIFNGTIFDESFIDSGSNGLFFYAAGLLPICSGINDDWYCPPVSLASPQQLVATNYGDDNTTDGPFSFFIGNATSLFNTSNSAFAELGGPAFGSGFDWGLPFFYGRSVFVGIKGRDSTNLGTGPYWAY